MQMGMIGYRPQIMESGLPIISYWIVQVKSCIRGCVSVLETRQETS